MELLVEVDTQHCSVTEPDSRAAEQTVNSLSSQSCYEAMKTCLDKFIATDRLILQCLNSYCRLYRMLTASWL